MARIHSKSQSGVTGTHVIDIEGYNQEVHDYLINRGAIPWTGWTSVFTATKFDPVHFPGCKAFHHSNGYTRLFMPDEDEALLFVLAFGHLIRSTHIRAINNLLKDTHE